ncbi:hypothetical protein CARUB_v10028487mg, partial [Capsella rubella]
SLLITLALDNQDLSVLQGSSSRLMVSSTYVVEFITPRVIKDAIYQEATEIVLVCWSRMLSSFDLYLIYPLFNHLFDGLFGICCLYFLCFGCIPSSDRG